MGTLVNHSQGERPDRRTRKAAGDGVDSRPESRRVNSHAQKCIGDGQGISTAGFCASRKFRNIGDIG